ncbi:MAG: SURF1 family protein [Acidimicrobiia bacterium]|nr:SURF1 family protein [Acidimicrobiia bacterium]
MRRLLTLRWIAGHLLAVTGVVAFVMFGFWQLDRHDQKREIKEGIETAAALPTIALEDADGIDLTYRQVVVAGEYDTGTEVLLFRALDGASGYHVLTPLRMADGRAIVVDRGWVPLEYDHPPVAPARPLEGALLVSGIIWPSASGDIPETLPPVLKRVDTGVIDAFTPYPLMDTYLVLLEQDPPAPGDLPVVAHPPEASLGPHLGYAGQWFLFALVVLVGYPILLRKTLRS